MKADLHLHSTASDGTCAPEELVRRAHAMGLTCMALTDHDSVEGVDSAAREARRLGMTLIPGVELSCGAAKEIHVLGYGIDPGCAAFVSFCQRRRQEREERAAQMVERLAQAGKPVSLKRVRELARGVVGRPHVARALVEAGHATSMNDAFDRFLTPGRCAYVPKREVKVAEGVAVICEAGGVAVLAHPMELKLGDASLTSLVEEWKAQGLAGVEVYHPSAANNQTPFLLSLVRREGLLVTGGSDYHGENIRDSAIFQGLDRWQTMESDVQALMRAMEGGR